MFKDWYEFILIVFILGGIIYASRRNGQANPETTGDLGKRLSKIEGNVRGIREELATVTKIENRVEVIERRAAMGSDVERVERQLAALSKRMDEDASRVGKIGEDVAAIRAAGDERASQLAMILQVVVQRGMEK